MSVFLIGQTITCPFIDRIQNNSDWVSRIGAWMHRSSQKRASSDLLSLGYVLVALIGLLVSLNVSGKAALSGWILLLITAIVYSLNAYFAVIHTSIAQRFVKRLQKRIDYSIDVFAPHLDLSKHVARRVWQESISTMILAEPELRIPKAHRIVFGHCTPAAPYLLGFQGTPGERLVENIKVSFKLLYYIVH